MRACARALAHATLLALTVARVAQAGNFGVTPVRVTLSPASPTASLVIENKSDEPVLVQSQMMAWSQNDGADVLEETRELLISPPIFRIAPGAAQTLRVGLMRRADPARQLTYRLLLQEVPPPPKPGQQGVSVALRLSLPVFVSPVAPVAARLRWQVKPASDGALMLSATNAGNAHVQLIDVKLLLADGTVLAHQQTGGYLLAGQARSWALEPKLPWRAGALELRAKTDGGDVNAEIRPATDKP